MIAPASRKQRRASSRRPSARRASPSDRRVSRNRQRLAQGADPRQRAGELLVAASASPRRTRIMPRIDLGIGICRRADTRPLLLGERQCLSREPLGERRIARLDLDAAEQRPRLRPRPSTSRCASARSAPMRSGSRASSKRPARASANPSRTWTVMATATRGSPRARTRVWPTTASDRRRRPGTPPRSALRSRRSSSLRPAGGPWPPAPGSRLRARPRLPRGDQGSASSRPSRPRADGPLRSPLAAAPPASPGALPSGPISRNGGSSR